MSYTYLVPPVPGTCIADPGELEALVSTAVPGTNIGFTYYATTAPDVVTYPEMKRFLWIDTSGILPVERHWNNNTLSWEQDLPEPGSITGDMIADYTIPLIKLDPTGGTPGYVVRLNSLGTEVIYDDTQNLFTSSNRLDVGVLSLAPVGAYVLYSDGVTNSWTTFASLFATGTLTLSQIDTTGATTGKIIGYDGAVVKWDFVQNFAVDNSIPVTKLEPGTANYILGTNVGGTATEWKSPTAVYNLIAPYINSTRYKTADASWQSIPAAASAQAFAHGLGVSPTRWGGFVVCTDVAGDGTYDEGDKIPWDNIYDAAGDAINDWSAVADDTNITLIRPNNGSGVMFVAAKDGSVHNESLTSTKWKCGAWADYYA